MLPEDLIRIQTPSDPSFSPDGQHHCYVLSTPNTEDDRYDTRIWVDDEVYTSGPGDSTPRWSPDGTRLAFLRKDSDERSQVFVIPISGGEAKQLTEFELGVSAIEWKPDGTALAAIATTYVDDWDALDDDERKRRPKRITTVPFKADGLGWIHDRKRHIWLIAADGSSEPVCLTPGSHDEAEPAWSPDGSNVAYITHTAQHQGLESGNELWQVDVDTGTRQQVGTIASHTKPSYSPSGKLHFLGNTDPNYPVASYLNRIEDDGSITNLTGHLDRASASLAAGPAAIRWVDDDAVVGFEDSGKFGIIRVSSSGEITTIVDGEQVVTGFDSFGDRTIYTSSVAYRPTEVFIDGEAVTKHNAGFESFAGEHFTIESDGYELDVWVFLPEGNEKVPVLLNVHGGPASQYGFGFFDEFQVYVDAGYGVVATNPRGSSGKGVDHLNAVRGSAWGDVDFIDVRAAVDAALTRFDRLDSDRMGVMGGSYGGFMTAWIIGQEDHWKSAVVERALISWASFSGTSDIGGVFPHNYLDDEYPDAWDTWWEKGPLSTVHNATTPTLVIHSEDDWRCPIEQAEQYFMGLVRNGTTAEFLRFPGEGHELSRSGKPKHRMERFEAILDWHNRHLA